MAVIGAISINMGVNTAGLQKGLWGASGLINQFGASMKLAGSGLGGLAKDTAKFGRGVAQDLGSLAKITGVTAVLRGARGALGLLGRGAISSFKGIGGLVSGAAAKINEFGSSLKTAGWIIGGFFAAHALAATLAIYKTVKAAMNLSEQTDRSRVVFGQFSDVVINASKKMAAGFSVSRGEFVRTASAFGAMFQGVGYTQGQAAALSVHFVKLAVDLSSLAHIPVEEAMEKIQSGLAGQVRPLREVGVFMSEAAEASYAAAHGITKLGEEMDETQKMEARVGLMTKSLKTAHGNLALTADSAANRMRAFWGEVDNLSSSIGQTLMPIVGAAFGDINTGLQVLQELWKKSGYAADEATIGVVGNAKEQTTEIGFIQKAIGQMADALQSVSLAWSYVQKQIIGGLSKIVGSITKFYEQIASLSDVFGVIAAQLGGLKFKSLSEDLKKLAEEKEKAFDIKANAKPWSDVINDLFQKARDKVKATRDELAKPGPDVTKFKPKRGAEKAIKAVKQENVAASFGSAEATNAILKSRFGGDQTAKDNAKIAKNTQDANGHLTTISKGISKLAGMGGGAANWEKL